ncbi:cation efflux system [Bacillus methanolicus PB1]|uniref:Cation efflux system n=1 Tax=Bacillus methanolicus PB1 TaxID=997296 RepID=I3E668_BACMT|nr:cation diffusion facilitator family transporter [Bacillus methanolicus]EIJ81989.1 cation efflux system [Bacillus methanolicus PB1]
MERNDQLSLGEKGAWLSIIAYIILASIKLLIAKFGHSEGLWADGLNNFTDVIASAAVLIGLKISRKPADHNHLYGHSRAESVASLVAAFIMISVGIQVLIRGIQNFFTDDLETPDWLTAWTALGSALAMYVVYRYNLKLGEKINSSSIKAVAYDNRSDALVSLGAFIGIAGTKFGIALLDVLTALAVGVLICKTAAEIFSDASYSLTDGFNQELLEQIEATIRKTPGVESIKEVKARMNGNQVLVEATVLVKPSLNVVESHNITENIEKNLLQMHMIENATIHIEPLLNGD